MKLNKNKDRWNSAVEKQTHTCSCTTLACASLSVRSGLVPRVTEALVGPNHVHTLAISAETVTQRALIYIWERIIPISCNSEYLTALTAQIPERVRDNTANWWLLLNSVSFSFLACSSSRNGGLHSIFK